MKISELSRRTGVTVATIKYYIREGLLPAGTPVTVTTAAYDAGHVDRLRLIRALVDIGNLSITTVGEVLRTLDQADRDAGARPAGRRPSAKARAAALSSAFTATHDALATGTPRSTAPPERALAAMAVLGWTVDPESAALHDLETALAGLDTVLLPPSEATLRAYGRAALTVAEADVSGTPVSSPAEIVRHTVIGTVLYEPVLIALRRLAQHQALARLGLLPPSR